MTRHIDSSSTSVKSTLELLNLGIGTGHPVYAYSVKTYEHIARC